MPGWRDALLRADDVHDALARIVEAEQRDAVLRRVLRQIASTMSRRVGIGDVARCRGWRWARNGRASRRCARARRTGRPRSRSISKAGASRRGPGGGRRRAASAPSSRSTMRGAPRSCRTACAVRRTSRHSCADEGIEDFGGCRRPHALPAHHVRQRALKRGNPVRLTDRPRMQRQRHDAPALLPPLHRRAGRTGRRPVA